MPKALTATAGHLSAINPVLGSNGTTLIGLNISVDLTYTDLTGTLPGTSGSMIFDGWAALSSQQKTNMQDIRDTILAAIAAELA